MDLVLIVVIIFLSAVAVTFTVAFAIRRTEKETGQYFRELREEITGAIGMLGSMLTNQASLAADGQKRQLEIFAERLDTLAGEMRTQMEATRSKVEERLRLIQEDNALKLEEMRRTVDDKLHITLENRLGESFRQVSERLEKVHQGLGEMQSLAQGVGDLKRVLTNVKTRGTWGEIQLRAMLEEVMAPEQYVENFAPSDGRERVEFAIRLPGAGGDSGQAIFLPIDAKFPLEDYERLLEAQEKGDANAMEEMGKKLVESVKKCARDISNKYILPPKTTDFAILYLPIEGLFAEVIRRPGLVERIQREHRVVLAGPTTLWALLTSLQMGFRTLAIERRTSEVWQLLSEVKVAWEKYGNLLDQIHRKLHQASEDIEKARRQASALGQKLSRVEEFPPSNEMKEIDVKADID
ncbi:MAG: DNA recombination protein RmuC [Syntrophales bacterium]|nr:DNA recombination protein RmuC [Syntrophales bacterium]